METEGIFAEAAAALARRDGGALIDTAQKLLDSEDELARASGYLLRGGAFEYGIGNIGKDLGEAASNYRDAAVLNPGPIPHWYLGRTLLKQQCYEDARHFLLLANSASPPLETHVDLGRLYEAGPYVDLGLAARHFLRAGIRGRRAGMDGYIRVLRARRHDILAGALDLVVSTISPLLRGILGKKFEAEF